MHYTPLPNLLLWTGSVFDADLVDVIFDVFDEDNDDKLGHDEFITV